MLYIFLRVSKNSKSAKYNYSKADFTTLKSEMDLNWEDLLTYLKTLSICYFMYLFDGKLISAMDISIPKKKITKKKHNTSLSEETRHCIKQKHRTLERYMENRDIEHYNKYTRVRNKAKSAVTRERKNLEKGI